ncbi:MAG: FAD-dependent oxidoreductase [Candidatus Hodarchaeales archaeon]|jgi:thioredoxin reductase (NADPH)
MENFTINVYGANWCSDCRRTKKYLGEQRIHYNWFDIEREGVEGEEALQFVYEANQKIYGKPKRKIPAVEVIKGDKSKIFIEPSNFELADYLGLAKKAKKDYYHAIIIGAGPAGLTAAIYLARDGYDVLIIEESTVGGQAFITNKLDNFPGFPEGINGSDFAANVQRQAERFGVEILSPHRVLEVSPCHEGESFSGCKFKIVKTDGQEFNCATALVATGSDYRQLIVPGSETLLGVSVHYCATCDGFFYKDKSIFVIGGGNSAFEESLFLKEKFAKHVTILIRGNEPRASPVLQEKVKDREGIEVWLNCEVTELIGESSLETVKVNHRDTGEVIEYHPDGIFVFIGLSPNTRFLKNIEMDGQGFLITDKFQTSVKGIFAAGDCRLGSVKQAVASAGEGAAAAIAMREFLSNY